MAAAARATADAPHIPVLLDAILSACAPIDGAWLDGTFGAGGYARGLLEAGADHVIGVDRDPAVFEMAAEWAGTYGDRLTLVEGTFSDLDDYSDKPLDGVVLDLGVSSMQLDQAQRGFSFMSDGPLDMRMSQSGPSAADIVADATEAMLADILYHYGEERAARSIARAIVKKRQDTPIDTTGALVRIVEAVLPRPKPGQSHPATRTFQALRIAVNDELGELEALLEMLPDVLRVGGVVAVISFHSLEDRMVKHAFRDNEHLAPLTTRPIIASVGERESNPRSRSAKLRAARRVEAAA